MNKHITVYDNDTFTFVPSEREYIETDDVIHYTEKTGDYYRSTETRRIAVYLDTANGLVVHDIKAYEKWINGL